MSQRKLKSVQIVRVAEFLKSQGERLRSERPTNPELEKIVFEGIGVNWNGQGLRAIAREMGIDWSAKKVRTVNPNRTKDVRWSFEVLADAVASLYQRFGEDVPEGVQIICNSFADGDSNGNSNGSRS